MELQYTFNSFLILILFGAAIATAVTASLYLLLRRGNAVAPDIDPPLRLRRWAATFFVSAGASLLWWLFIVYAPYGGFTVERVLICTTLDVMTSLPAMLCTMLAMLQDRRRPLWPVFIVEALALCNLLMVCLLGKQASQMAALIFLLLVLCVTCTMLIALRQYDRWLLDNYADLEHKEVWQTFLLMAAFLLVGVSYGLANEFRFFEVFVLVADIVVIVFLLWRVESLQTLEPAAETVEEPTEKKYPSDKIEALLQQYCIEGQFYLRHDASLIQLAKVIGTNTLYLSRHIGAQGLTYNSYINRLRIEHFVRLYQETAKVKCMVSAADLAGKCGFRSYSTFSRAFKQIMGQSVTAWTHAQH